jgi:hypothetical protein
LDNLGSHTPPDDDRERKNPKWEIEAISSYPAICERKRKNEVGTLKAFQNGNSYSFWETRRLEIGRGHDRRALWLEVLGEVFGRSAGVIGM